MCFRATNVPNFLLLVSIMLTAFAAVALPARADVSATVCPYAWARNLTVGSVGDDVLKLQQFLNSDEGTVVARFGPGSRGNESKNYGPATKRAVAKFQEKYAGEVLAPAGLAFGSGFVGTLTRAKLNSLCAAPAVDAQTPQNTPTVAGQASASSVPYSDQSNLLTVSAAEQPEPTLAPAGAGWVPFTSFTLTAGSSDVTVNSVTVERTGWGTDGAFDSIALTDEDGNGVGVEKGLRSNHKVELGEPFVVPAGTSKTYTVVANMATDLSSYDGQMPVLQINAIHSSATVTGTLPIKGASQTVNSSLVIGKAYSSLSQYDPSTATNRYINDKNVRFSGIRFSADSKEDLRLSQIIWDQTGTAGAGDIANITTIVNGVPYPTTIKGRKYISDFVPDIVIKKGNYIDIYVQGDLAASGSNRTVEFDIRKSGDVSITGDNYGFYVLIYPESATATSGHSVFITSDGTTDGDEGSPFFSGSVVTINAGTFTSVGKN